MAMPVNFKEANFTWQGFNETEDHPEVADLHTWHNNKESISCWKMTWLERFYTLATGKVWVRVWGDQPPIYVEGKFPFVKSPNPL